MNLNINVYKYITIYVYVHIKYVMCVCTHTHTFYLLIYLFSILERLLEFENPSLGNEEVRTMPGTFLLFIVHLEIPFSFKTSMLDIDGIHLI